MIDEMKGNVIRLKVFSDIVESDKRKPKPKYAKLNFLFPIMDHMRMLKIGNEQIGFIVSPYNIQDGHMRSLDMDDHIVMEMKQMYHPNAQTFAVIHKDYYSQAIEWKMFEVNEVK